MVLSIWAVPSCVAPLSSPRRHCPQSTFTRVQVCLRLRDVFIIFWGGDDGIMFGYALWSCRLRVAYVCIPRCTTSTTHTTTRACGSILSPTAMTRGGCKFSRALRACQCMYIATYGEACMCSFMICLTIYGRNACDCMRLLARLRGNAGAHACAHAHVKITHTCVYVCTHVPICVDGG